MFQRIDPPLLDLKDPWKGDLFQRGKIATTLCSLLKSTNHSSVVGISAPYGFGKTFFLKRLREQINNEDGWAIYVNAWEHDYLDSPLLALLDALKVAASDQLGSKKAKEVLKDIGNAAVPALVKVAGKRLVETVIGSDGTKDVLDAISEASGKSAELLISRYVKGDSTHQTLSVLREQIRKFVAEHVSDSSPYKSLTIIVDELDRARPDFSIRFLETIKHVFDLSQVVFVIGCDREVIASSASHEYGIGLPIDGYLRRLFDFWLELPKPESKKYVNYCVETVKLISDEILVSNDHWDAGSSSYADYLILGCNSKPIPLRFIEQSVCHLNIMVRTVSPDSSKYSALTGWLQGLRFYSEEAYAKYISARNWDMVKNVLEELPLYRGMDKWAKAWIIACATRNVMELNLADAKATFGDDLGIEVAGLLGDRVFRRVSEPLASQLDARLRVVGAQFSR